MIETILFIGWLLVLLFVIWEFVFANNLPRLYASAKPRSFRIADVLIGALAALSLYYLITN